MPKQITIDDDTDILVELEKGRGVVNVSRGNIEDITQKSEKAMNAAMSTISSIAKRTAATVRSIKLTEQPDTVEMSFGLKLTSEANALVARAEAETHIQVKLVWQNDKTKQEKS